MTVFEDLGLLRAFVAIAESGSISAGARRLKISQPTLSRYLRTLEDRCETALLQRDTHHMNLTETGRRLLDDARAMLELADEANHRLHTDQTTLCGHLRVFATLDSGQFVGTRLLARFLKENPRLTAELTFTNRPLHLIQEGCDVALVAGRLLDDTVVAKPAGSIVHFPVAVPALVKRMPPVQDPEDLQKWPWIELSASQFRDPGRLSLHGTRGRETTLHLSPILLSEGVTSIREAVLAGLGAAVLPQWLIEDDLRTGRLVRVLPAWRLQDLPMHVVHASNRRLPLRVRTFVDFAAAYLKKFLAGAE